MNPSSDIYQGLHILLVTEDDARGKALTKALRDHQARVGDLKTGARDPAALRGIDLAIVDVRYKAAAEARMNEMRDDVRARFASVVTVDFEALIRADGSVLLNALSEQVAPLVAVDRELTERARGESNFSTSLAPLGPSRTLRALSLSGHTLLVELHHATLQATVEVSNELLVSASAARAEKRWEAWSALVRILGLSDAEVRVSRRNFTSAMNIMEPVDQALEVAAQERHCSAPQIAEEESEALRVSQAPAARAAAGAQRESLPARGASLNPGYTPPRPPIARAPEGALPFARAPEGALRPGRPGSPPVQSQRTLLGIRPNLPAITAAPAANDPNSAPAAPPFAARAPEDALRPSVSSPEPRTSAGPAEGPRYAHRPGAIGNQRPGMTLLGVAPGSIPGLAELRAQAEQAERAKREEELARAATQNALPPVKLDAPAAPLSAAPPHAPAKAAREATVERAQEPASFDPPTGRMSVSNPLLDELDDLSDELSMAASPLSTPLPPPRQDLPDKVPGAGDEGDEGDEGDDDGPREALTERAPPPSEEDMMSETFPTPTDLRSQLLAASTSSPLAGEAARLDALAKTERPPAPSGEEASGESPFDEPPTRNYPASLDATVLGTGEPEREPPSTAGDETLVTAREPKRRKSRVGVLSATAVLLGLAGLLTHAALRERDPTPTSAKPSASAKAPVVMAPTPPVAAAPEPAASLTAAEPEPSPPSDSPLMATPAATDPPTDPPTGTPEVPSAAAAVAAAPGETPAQPEATPQAAPADAQSAAATPTPSGDLASLIKQGLRALSERNAAAARPLFEQALTLDPANPHVRAGLAETLLALNEPAAALTHTQAAVKLRPKRARYQVLMGDVLAALGKLDDAQSAWNKALSLDPNESEAKKRLSK